MTSGLAAVDCSSRQFATVSVGEEGEWSQIAGSTSPPLPSSNTPPRTLSPRTLACALLTVSPGESVALASMAESVAGLKDPAVPAPAPTNDSAVEVETASGKMPGPIWIVSPADAWPTAFWIVRQGPAGLVHALLPPLSLPPLAAVATYRVTAALATLTPKPRETTTVSTAMINLRLVMSNYERSARLEDVVGP